jgi:hypothetical protein
MAERDDDASWLLARERGEPEPPVSAAIAERYARLGALLADLPAVPAGLRPSADWRQRALAAIDAEPAAGAAEWAPGAAPAEATAPAPRTSATRTARASRRSWMVASATCAAAAAMLLAIVGNPFSGRGGDDSAPALTIDVKQASGARRGVTSDDVLSVGDALILRAAAAGSGELRLYDDAGIELARCAEAGAGCVVKRTGERSALELSVPLRVPGVLRPVLFTPPLGGAPAGLDADLAAAARAGTAVVTREPVRVR